MKIYIYEILQHQFLQVKISQINAFANGTTPFAIETMCQKKGEVWEPVHSFAMTHEKFNSSDEFKTINKHIFKIYGKCVKKFPEGLKEIEDPQENMAVQDLPYIEIG